MKRPLRVMLAASTAALVLTAIPVSTDSLLGTAPASAAPGGSVDPPLFDKIQGGGTVRVNVLTDRRADLPSAAQAGDTLVSYDTLPLVTLRVNSAGLQALSAEPGVISVTEDIPVPPALNESTARIGSDRTAVRGKTGAGTAVAVLDTGVATRHPFLAGRIRAEACFSASDAFAGATSLCPGGATEQEGPGSADAETGPCATLGTACSHGTHVTGIAAGDGTGLTGAPARGVAPGAGIIAIQVFSRFDNDAVCGPGRSPCVLSYTSSQIKGLEKVRALKRAGTDVIAANMSLGGERRTEACLDDPRKPVIDSLYAEGVATVVASGNNGSANAVGAPGCIPSAITVGSTTDDDQLSTFTNRSPLLDLFAPGTAIVSSVPGGGYASKSGTSMATPHVAGALAVLRQTHPDKSLAQLEAVLKADGTPIAHESGSTPRLQLRSQRSAAVNEAGGNGRVRWADFDGDGKPDYITVADNGAVSVWLNRGGNPTGPNGWHPLGQVATGTTTDRNRARLADFDGDGRFDYLVINADGSVNAWLNRGGDQVAPWQGIGKVAHGTTTDASKVRFADWDGDGKTDYLVFTDSGAVDVHLNRGGDQVAPWQSVGRVTTGATNDRTRVRFADNDGDGKADYHLLHPSGKVDLYLNRGGDVVPGGGWQSVGQIATGVTTDHTKVQFVDFTADTHADYVLAGTDGSATVFAWNGGDPAGTNGWTHLGKVASGGV
ncbi:S8 family serine peptidase [Streptomyces sp. NPDC059247]|uniref:S8 family serine peptidase n=1 Tax=Streptomyces sp. NPDC059247 TaxID=3346790 RepID=UPI003688BDDE